LPDQFRKKLPRVASIQKIRLMDSEAFQGAENEKQVFDFRGEAATSAASGQEARERQMSSQKALSETSDEKVITGTHGRRIPLLSRNSRNRRGLCDSPLDLARS
jgi:hypothetical protein